MRGTKKRSLRLIVDLCMSLLLLCLMAYQVTGEELHEWFGIGMTVLLILHHVLNYKWYATLCKGRYNAYRIVTVLVNTLLLASIGLTAACGMAMSSYAVPFLYRFLKLSFARQYHLAMSFWSFVLMGLHLGLHIPAMTAGLNRYGKVKAVVSLLFVPLAGYGLWLFVKAGIPDYLFFRTPFAFLDYEKPALQVFAENLAMLTGFAFLGACCAGFCKAIQRKGRKLRALPPLLLALAALLICFLLVRFKGGLQDNVPSWGVSSPSATVPGTGRKMTGGSQRM